MKVKIHPSWEAHLEEEFQKPYFGQLVDFVKKEYAEKTIYPKGADIFNAFEYTHFEEVKVVVLGQDPYHGEGQAHGLSFSVPKGIKTPPSLQNIYKEIKNSFPEFEIPNSGELTGWAKQGVLLLNAVLTVEAGKAGSHRKKGWETLTDAIIQAISEEKENVVFLLWGAYAKSKIDLIDKSKHSVLTSVHPSPLSAHRGFLGCGHFIKCNDYLTLHDKSPINWQNTDSK